MLTDQTSLSRTLARMAQFGIGMSLLLACGCTEAVFLAQSPDDVETVKAASRETIYDVCVPLGMQPMPVEAVALVTQLPGSGGDPPPSPQRDELLDQMRKNGVANPNSVLANNSTSLVVVRGYIKPGAQKGDTFDLEVRAPAGSETTSLRGGWLMPTHLTEFRLLSGQMRRGHVLAVAEGPILIETGENGDPTRGRVLGGGNVLRSQPLALGLKPGSQSTVLSARLEDTINRRFSAYEQGVKQGVAKAKTNEYIELKVHPRYQQNINRYLQVVRSIALRETSTQRAKRIKLLEKQLLDPITSQRAALRLEAIGDEAKATLKLGLQSPSPEVRFYSAEALAYLDDEAAVEPLKHLAANEPAFRVFALTALATMRESVNAYGALRDLLQVASAETRYGAFRALWTLDGNDPFIRGEMLGSKFSYHVLPLDGPPMIHVTRSFRPEIVLFGANQHFHTPLFIEAGPRIMLHSDGGGKISVHKLAVGEPEQQRLVSTKVDDVIRAIVEVGGTYPDVVQALQQAADLHLIESRFMVDALPRAGRTYFRDDEEENRPTVAAGQELPDLPDMPEEESSAEEQNPPRVGGFFDRLNPFQAWR